LVVRYSGECEPQRDNRGNLRMNFDEEGRFVALKESILGLTGEAAEKELEKGMALAAHTYFTLARNTQTN
jgi:hypothetical protein